MNSSTIAKLYVMAKIAGRGVCFGREGKRSFDGIKKTFTLPYTDFYPPLHGQSPQSNGLISNCNPYKFQL